MPDSTTAAETRDTKLEIIMGRPALNKLAAATVLVLGCGGVGSNCIEALARGGVGHFIILDKDIVAPSNINRQAIAFHSTIGQRKVDVMEAMIHDINPAATVIKRTEYILSENTDEFFNSVLEQAGGKIDYVGRCHRHHLGQALNRTLRPGTRFAPGKLHGRRKQLHPNACTSPISSRPFATP